MQPFLFVVTLMTRFLGRQKNVINHTVNIEEGGRSNIRGRRPESATLMLSSPSAVDAIDYRHNIGTSSAAGFRTNTSMTENVESSVRASDIYGTTVTVKHHHPHHPSHGPKHHNVPLEPSSHDDNHGGSPITFDFYVYSMSYQPEFCRENNKKFDGCRAFNESWEGQLTIHGLWPNNDDGTYPSSCTNEQLDISLLQSLQDSLTSNWPNIKALSASSPEHTAFWSHEWSKHGTCSGLSQLDYFTAALGLLLPTPAVVKERYGSSGEVTRQELEEGYAHQLYDNVIETLEDVNKVKRDDVSPLPTVILICKSGYLSEVRVCYEKKPDGVKVGEVGERIQCPDTIVKEDTCGDTIKIASFDDVTPSSGLISSTS